MRQIQAYSNMVACKYDFAVIAREAMRFNLEINI